MTEHKTIVDNLLKAPKKDKGKQIPRFIVNRKGLVQQADLLFLPNDHGYKYALVIAECAFPRVCDAQAIKSKDGNAIIDALTAIYTRDILTPPKRLVCDSGTEFGSAVKGFLKRNGIHLKVTKVGRHRSTAIVEARNKAIGVAIHKLQLGREMLSNEVNTEWRKDL